MIVAILTGCGYTIYCCIGFFTMVIEYSNRLNVVVGLHVYGDEADARWHADPLKMSYLVLSPSYTENDYVRVVNTLMTLIREALNMDLKTAARAVIDGQLGSAREYYELLCVKKPLTLDQICKCLNPEIDYGYYLKLQEIDITTDVDPNPTFTEVEYLN
jgi:hypothetical protein